MSRLAIVSTHPIQYNAPLFRALSASPDVKVKVFYGWEGTANQLDPEFGQNITWDLPLLSGYDWEMVPNVAPDPGTHHFGGLKNPKMVKHVRSWDPDVILVYGWAWQSHLQVMRHFKGRRPVFLRGDSTLASFSGPAWKRWVRRPALRWIYQHVDLALSPGQMNRAYLHAVGVNDARIAHMPHSVEVDRFTDPALQVTADVERRELGISDEAIVFGFAGKFVPRKNCSILIEAFRQLKSKASCATHLVLVGDGPLRAELEAQAKGDTTIHFLGFRNQSQMPTAYRLCDVFVLPSSVESWGLGVNEALASGRPVIVSNRVGAGPDLVTGRPYGRVVANGDPVALAMAMDELSLARTALADLGEQASRDASAFSIREAADRLLKAVLAWSGRTGQV